MAGSTTKGATVPEEIDRQSLRIREQLNALNKILDTISNDLDSMQQLMANYNPDLVKQIVLLKSAVDAYKVKAGKIYTSMSDSLERYALGMMQNLEELTGIISDIKQIVDAL